MEFSDLGQVKDYEESQVQYFLDRFYLSRVSIRLLIYQHSSSAQLNCPSMHVPSSLAMCFGDEVPIHPSHLGFVDPHCFVEDVINGSKGISWGRAEETLPFQTRSKTPGSSAKVIT